jgi:hypothetical protein
VTQQVPRVGLTMNQARIAKRAANRAAKAKTEKYTANVRIGCFAIGLMLFVFETT